MKILVVDDEPNIREICVRLLARFGHEAVPAETGEEALRVLNSNWDIILTDLDMPGSVDANELTRKFRAKGYADVIIMTGNPELGTAIQALRDGAYDYLIKPFSEEMLKNAVGRCQKKRLLSEELAREQSLRAKLNQAYTELDRMAKVREIFGQFATPEVAQLVLNHPDDFKTQAEQKVLTILFADVRDFTLFAGQQSPSMALASLNEIFDCLVSAIQSEGGILNKFLGDGVMALFGAPIALKDHATAAARTALKARAAIEHLNAERLRQNLKPLRLGIGINTGEVVAGCLGTKNRTEYTVIGHAVNVASRLENAAGPNQILLGPQTVELLKSAFNIRHLGPINLAGIPKPMPVAELVGQITPEASG